MSATETANYHIQKAQLAAAVFQEYSQEEIDRIVYEVYRAAFNERVRLAKMAVEETGLGKWQDKVLKNVVATELIYEHIKHQKTVGVLAHDNVTGITEVAQALGPILAVTPVTNPTSTVFFKILICLKSRNPIIISPHPKAVRCCTEAVKICYEAALKADAPEDCIQIFSEPSIELTQVAMTNRKLGLILATGGPSLVKSAYSSGTPAIGVGPGNVPILVEKSADIPFTVQNILISKTFDNGTICASEQAVVAEKVISDDLKEEFKRQHCYFLTPQEIEQLEKVVTNPKTGGTAANIVGQSANTIAKIAGINVPPDTQVLLAPITKVGKEEPLSLEKLAPILAYYECDNFDEAAKICIELNHAGGLGHTAGIYSNNEEKIIQFCDLMDAGRVVINTPSSQGGVGGIFNMLPTSLTLGCGSGGKNITSENISAKHLINIKRCCRRRPNERFCRFPTEKLLDEKLKLSAFLIEYNKNY